MSILTEMNLFLLTRLCIWVCLMSISGFVNGQSNQHQSSKQIYKKWANSVVTIVTEEKTGTGFFDSKGNLYTAFHVVKDAKNISLIFPDGFKVSGVALQKSNVDADIALLSTPLYKDRTKREIGPQLGDWAASQVGDRLTVIGSPLGLSGTLTEGLLSAKRKLGSLNYLQLSASISPGSSGSPVINGQGHIIGMAVSSITLGQNLNLAVSVLDLKATQLMAPDWARDVVQDRRSKRTLPHTQVFRVAYSPDGQLLASGGGDGTIKIWDVKSGKLVRTIDGHPEGVVSVVFSPDGSKLATNSTKWDFRVWDARTGKAVERIPLAKETIYSLDFSPDGNFIAVLDSDGVNLIDSTTGRMVASLIENSEGASSVIFSPNGLLLAGCGCYEETVIIWDVRTGGVKFRLKGNTDMLLCASFSADGQILAAGGNDREIKLWNVHSGILLRSIQTGSEVDFVSFSPDGLLMATAHADKTIKLWETKSGRLIETLKGHNGFVNCVRFSPDGLTLVSASSDDTIKFWKVSH